MITDRSLFIDYFTLGGTAFRLDMLGRYAGRLANANLMAFYLLMIVWACVTSATLSSHKLRWFWLLPVLPALSVTMFTGSRKGLLGIPVTACLAYLSLRAATHRRRTWPSVVVGVTLASAAGYLALNSVYASRLTGLSLGRADASFEGRSDMAWAGLEMWLANPVVGAGFEQFRGLSWQFGVTHEVYSHSTVIETLASTGLVGFTLYLLALASLAKQAVSRLRAGAERNRRLGLAASWLVALFAFFSLFAVAYDRRFAWPVVGVMSSSFSLTGEPPTRVLDRRRGALGNLGPAEPAEQKMAWQPWRNPSRGLDCLPGRSGHSCGR